MECRAVVAVRAGPQPTTMSLDYGTAYGQAHSHSLGLCRKECIENSLEILRVDSYTGVSHRNEQLSRVVPLRPYHEAPGPICDAVHRLDAIQGQIHDHLLQLDPVAHRGREID